MSEEKERLCAGCGDTEEMARLEKCAVCNRWVCGDCNHRALGRRFCSPECGRVYYFSGDEDDQENEDE